MTTEFGYSVRVKSGAGWRAFPRVRLMVSVGQEYHEGKKLAAVVAWINRNPGIAEVHVSVNDHLQRHNLLAAGVDAGEAGRRSRAEGSLWLARNQSALAAISAGLVVTRWQDWTGRLEFDGVRRALADQLRADPVLEQAVETDAQALAARKTRRGEGVPASWIGHSRDYVREELAVFALQCASLPAAEIYPGSNLASAAYLVGRKGLRDEIRPLAGRHFTRIDFARIDATPALRPAPRLG